MRHGEQPRRRTRSAANSWFSWVRVRKSLILEASAATSRAVFAINRMLFAMSPVFAFGRPAAFSSLSNSLKEKEKIHKEGQEIACKGMPRVKAVLPSVTHAAYFLGHEFHESETPYSWQLMAMDSFEIKGLQATQCRTMSPRVVLRVASLYAQLEAGR
jgi:hypothetical protein